MSELFHKYQSRQFQFTLELAARLEANREVSNTTLYEMAQRYGADHPATYITPLVKAGILEKTTCGVRQSEDFILPQLPLSYIEERYLQHILNQPEAAMFLEPDFLKILRTKNAASLPYDFLRYGPLEPEQTPRINTNDFSVLLSAIRTRRWIHYEFRSREHTESVSTQAIPWRLEFSAYDNRWWIILYLPAQQRTVKARLSNLSNIRVGSYAQISDDEIEDAMDKLLEADPVVLRILPEKNALERCAKVFERQMLQQIQREPEGTYLLTFHYYKFDTNEILRKLLYLGPSVQLLSPKSMRSSLCKWVNAALGG